MKILTFEVNGEPVAKGRPKFANRGGYVRAYTPKKTADYEKKVGEAFKEAYPEHTPFARNIPLEVAVDVYKTIPKSWTKKKREQVLRGEIMPTEKPDADNYLKAVLDGLNGIAWEDDSSIITARISKHYEYKGREACVVIKIGVEDIVESSNI